MAYCAVVTLSREIRYETHKFRILKAVVGTSNQEVWRWVLTDEINGFKITKRSTKEMHSESEAISDAELNGIEIIYPGV